MDEKTNLNPEMLSNEQRTFIEAFIRAHPEPPIPYVGMRIIYNLMRHVLFLEEQQERIKVFIPENMLIRIDDQGDYKEKNT